MIDIRRIGIEDGKDYWQCVKCHSHWISEGRPQWEHVCKFVPEGVGTEFMKITHSLGIRPCRACEAMAQKLNEIGICECKLRFEEIVWDIASRSWVPFSEQLVGILLRRAIKRAERRVPLMESCACPVDLKTK
jgi:hypothetical protein